MKTPAVDQSTPISQVIKEGCKKNYPYKYTFVFILNHLCTKHQSDIAKKEMPKAMGISYRMWMYYKNALKTDKLSMRAEHLVKAGEYFNSHLGIELTINDLVV